MRRKNKIYKKFWLSGGILILVTSSILVWSKNEKTIPHQNLLDTKISLHAQKPITQNAVAANAKFKEITFAQNLPEKSFWADQLAAVSKAIKSFNQNKKTETREQGVWLWTPIMQMTPDYIEQILSGAQKNRINVIYLSIDSYLDIFTMPKNKEREKQQTAFSEKLEDFLIRAKKYNIAVDAEAGWQNWAEEGHEYKAFAVVNFVKNFNNTRKNKFRGFQYGVEPYLLERYEEEKNEVLKNFVSLIDQTEKFLSDSDLQFSVVVPDFFDEKDELTPKFSYQGTKTFVFEHLLKILDRRKNSTVILMSYRNFAEGEDGSIEVSLNEMRTSQKYDTKIIIAQETGEVPPPYITFHNTSKKYLNFQLAKINDALGSNPNFGGIAIHYANAFLALR